ncbi:MAG: tRNA-dihydrouridine synthase family protein [Planctomycetota bacterium]
MGCDGNTCSDGNATPASPGVAPGLDRGRDRPEAIDRARRIAERLAERFGEGGVDPRVPAVVPGFDGPFFQAGLAGYSDAAMRIIARRHGCPMCVTEALLDRTLLAGGRGFAKADLGDIANNVPGGDEDHPLCGQIMGSEPGEMAAGAVKMVEQGTRDAKSYRKMAVRHEGTEAVRHEAVPTVTASFATIDVNLACPVKKIQRKARGGHWLAQPDGAIAILQAVRDALPAEVPTTVKMRRSFDDTEDMRDAFYRIFDAAYDMGYAWVTVHGRTVRQRYVGPSRWDLLREITQRAHPGRHRERVVFGSGDVWNAEDVFFMLDYAGVQAASVARGCIGNPWIFRQCRQMLAGDAPAEPTIAEQRAVLTEHFRLALAENHQRRNAELATSKSMRKFGIQFSRHHPNAEAVRRRMIEVSSLADWHAVLDEHYTPVRSSPRRCRR